jgi:hypothetical protein
MNSANSYAERYPVYATTGGDDSGRGKAKSYFQGLAAGILGGAVVAILLPRLFRDSRPSADELLRSEPQPHDQSQQTGFDFVSRRENPESFGDPSILSGDSSPSRGIAFSRPGGAPGGKAEAERLATPGQPGQHLDYTDASEGVHMQSRSLDLGKRR